MQYVAPLRILFRMYAANFLSAESPRQFYRGAAEIRQAARRTNNGLWRSADLLPRELQRRRAVEGSRVPRSVLLGIGGVQGNKQMRRRAHKHKPISRMIVVQQTENASPDGARFLVNLGKREVPTY